MNRCSKTKHCEGLEMVLKMWKFCFYPPQMVKQKAFFSLGIYCLECVGDFLSIKLVQSHTQVENMKTRYVRPSICIPRKFSEYISHYGC